MAKVGYGRINSIDPSLDDQKSKLDENGCEKVFLDKHTGMAADGPRLKEVLNYVRQGDSLVITRLDRSVRGGYPQGQGKVDISKTEGQPHKIQRSCTDLPYHIRPATIN